MSVPSPAAPARIESWEVLDLLTALVQKSLVVYEEDERGQGRYRLLETVRQYARDRLLESGEGEAVRGRHLDFFLALAEGKGPQPGPHDSWLDQREREHDNLRAALAWSGEQGPGEEGLRLGAALWRFWSIRGHLQEGRAHLEAMLVLTSAETRTAARAEALRGAGMLALNQGDHGPAGAPCEESLAIFRELDDKEGIAYSLWSLALVAQAQEDYGAARAFFQESLAIARELGDKVGMAYCLSGLGGVIQAQGNPSAAQPFFEESLSICRELGDRNIIAWSLLGLGTVTYAQGDCRAARTLLEDSLAIFREIGHKLVQMAES